MPSKAALLAAHAIAKAYGSVGGNYERDADIIDREFVAIVAALRDSRKLAALGEEAGVLWLVEAGAEIRQIHERIDAALDAAESVAVRGESR